MYPLPKVIAAEVWTRLPDSFRHPAPTTWGRMNFPGHGNLACFLEGPSFDRQGRLYVVDIPFGRIFRIDRDANWTLVARYDGWPNGLKIHADGRIFVADYRLGIMILDPDTGSVTHFVQTWRSEGFRGVNDMCFASNGDLYFTDQGQTGLHDPTGRVFRMRAVGAEPGHLECLIDRGPSPNGLVLNVAENQLYVAMTRDNAVWRLPLHGDGGVSKVGRFIQMSGGIGPDGMALDEEGGLVIAHPGTSVWRFDATGRPTHVIELPDEIPRPAVCTNVAFGGEDGRTLYIVESVQGLVLRVRMDVPGRRMFSHADPA
jgi:gluconolactonase